MPQALRCGGSRNCGLAKPHNWTLSRTLPLRATTSLQAKRVVVSLPLTAAFRHSLTFEKLEFSSTSSWR